MNRSNIQDTNNEWRYCVGFGKALQIYRDGRCWNTLTQKWLTPYYPKKGYPRFIFSVDGKLYCRNIHRMVALAFVPNPDNKSCVCHKDENPLNFHADNLEWGDYKYNNNYGSHPQRISDALRGRTASDETKARMSAAHTGLKRVPIEQYDLNGNLLHTWKSMKEAGRALQIPPSYISKCCAGKRPHAGGYIWKKQVI